MLTDLRAVKRLIQPIGSLQPRFPLPIKLSKEWPIINADVKYCFITIPL